MKSAVVFEGPGFADQRELVEGLKFKGFDVHKYFLGLKSKDFDESVLRGADLVLLRAPWTATPEEMLMCRGLTERLRPAFAGLQAHNQNGLVLGIGRGALILFLMGWLSPWTSENVVWSAAFKNDGPWLETELTGSSTHLYSLAQGRALPSYSGQAGLSESEGAESVPAVVARVGQQSVAWAKGRNIFVSFTDLLAYTDRTQLPDYGYGDLLKTPTQIEVLETLLERHFVRKAKD